MAYLRQKTRSNLNIPCFIDSEDYFISVFTKNISLGGTLVSLRNPKTDNISIGKDVLCQFSMYTFTLQIVSKISRTYNDDIALEFPRIDHTQTMCLEAMITGKAQRPQYYR